MVRVNLQEIAPTGGYNEIVELPAVPREGEAIAINLDDGTQLIRTVIWTPGNPDYDVQVRFR